MKLSRWSTLAWVAILVFMPVSELIKYEQNVRLRASIMIHSESIKARLEWIEIQLGSRLPG